ncbi:MAG: hypothetical protein GXY14_11085 [Spirochaetes bacterium]|nr:hypothetical protein [Spirochaetota bacterium]
MQNLRYSERLPAIVSLIVCAIGLSSVSAGWKKIGFSGKEIRALAVGNDVLRDRQVVFIPVDDSGVFTVSGPDDSMYQFLYQNSPQDRPTGRIHSLLVAENGATVLVGSDSGLYGGSIYFSSLPIWRKTSFASTETVTDLAESDSVFCAVTASGVYRAKNAFGTWWPCSLSGAPVRPASGSVFTSITSWPVGYGFVVGSAAAGSGAATGKVIFGSRDARSWTDGVCIQECTCINGDVYSLAADTHMTIYAGTSKGVFSAVDFDTGCWHSHPPQLEMPIRDMCLARMNSSGMPPDIYVATDSGVYLKSIQTTASAAWNRLFDMKTFAVEVMEVSGEYIIYAGTIDGLWKYDKSTSVIGIRSGKLPHPAAERPAVMYSIDGRMVSRKNRERYRGVYITTQGTCRTRCNFR